jgi:hypothetical protein
MTMVTADLYTLIAVFEESVEGASTMTNARMLALTHEAGSAPPA